MNRPRHWPKQGTRLLDNYRPLLILTLAILFSLGATAQRYDSTKKRQPIGAYGFDWNNGAFKESLGIPATGALLPRALKDTGQVAYFNGYGYIWALRDGVLAWYQNSGSGGSGSDVELIGDSLLRIGTDTIRIKFKPTHFETDFSPPYAFQDGDTIRQYPRLFALDSLLWNIYATRQTKSTYLDSLRGLVGRFDNALIPPSDSNTVKNGIANFGGNLYVGDGVRYRSVSPRKSSDTLFFPNGDTAILGGISSITTGYGLSGDGTIATPAIVDTSKISSWARLYKVVDSIRAIPVTITSGLRLLGDGTVGDPMRLDTLTLSGAYIKNQYTSKESKNLWVTRVKADSGFFNYLKLPNIEFGNPDSVIFKISGTLMTIASKNRGYYITGAGNTPLINYQTQYWNGSAWVNTTNFGAGAGALTSNSGAFVIGFGNNAGASNTGSFGTFLGMSAGASNTASNVTFTGYTAGEGNTGAFATGTGHQSLVNNTGIYGTSFGARGGQHNTGGYFTGTGFANGQFNTGEGLSADGYAAGQYNTADSVAATGYQSLQYNNSPRRTAYGNNTGNQFISDISKSFASANVSGTTITITAHGFGTVGKKVNLRYTVNSGTTVGGLVSGSRYQFTIASANTLTLSSITNAGSGTFTLEKELDRTNSTEIGNGANATKANQVMLGNTAVTELYTYGVIRANAVAYSSGGYKPMVYNTTDKEFQTIDQVEVYPTLTDDSLRLTDGSTVTAGVRVQSDVKIKMQTGSNKSVGTATLAAGTVTVNTTAVTSSSLIFVTVNTPGGTQGFLSVPSSSIVNGTSFVINSSSNTETSTVNWWIIN